MNAKTPSVTVLMPVHNAGKYLKESIESVLTQTYSDFELLIIDDGSSDDTPEVISRLKNKDNRIRVISRPQKGLIDSLNEGIDASRGKWIARMDADDICMQNRLEEQILFCEKDNIALCGSYIKTFGATLPRTRRYVLSDRAVRAQLLFNTAFAHPAIFVKADVVNKYRYSKSAGKVEDYELWTRLASDRVPMANIPKVLLKYRKTSGQITSKSRDEQDICRFEVAKKYKDSSGIAMPDGVLAACHNRSGTLQRENIEEAIDFFSSIINLNLDTENVFNENLFKALMHNIYAFNPEKLPKQIQVAFGRKKMAVLYSLKKIGLSPKKAFWKYLYAFS